MNKAPRTAEQVLAELRYWINEHKSETPKDAWYEYDVEIPLDVVLEVERVLSALLEGPER